MKVRVGGGLEIWTTADQSEIIHEVDLGYDPPTAEVAAVVEAGHRVLVRLQPDPGPALHGTTSESAADAGFLAAASIYAWLGAAVFVVPESSVDRLRQVLEMVASIKGVRPPTLTRRALA